MQNVVHVEQDDNCVCVDDGKGKKVCSPEGCGENTMHCRVHYWFGAVKLIIIEHKTMQSIM